MSTLDDEALPDLRWRAHRQDNGSTCRFSETYHLFDEHETCPNGCLDSREPERPPIPVQPLSCDRNRPHPAHQWLAGSGASNDPFRTVRCRGTREHR